MSLFSRNKKDGNTLIMDYLNNNINNLFPDYKDSLKIDLKYDTGILNYYLYNTKRILYINIGELQEINKKLDGFLNQPINIYLLKDIIIYFKNDSDKNKNGLIEDLNLNLIFESSLATDIEINFTKIGNKFKNSNINIIKKDKKSPIQYFFESEDYDIFKNKEELEKYIKNNLFSNPGSIIDGDNILLIFQLDKYNKYYKPLYQQLTRIDGHNQKIKEYQDYFIKNISSGKYSIEIINKYDKDDPELNTLFWFEGDNLEILLRKNK